MGRWKKGEVIGGRRQKKRVNGRQLKGKGDRTGNQSPSGMFSWIEIEFINFIKRDEIL